MLKKKKDPDPHPDHD